MSEHSDVVETPQAASAVIAPASARVGWYRWIICALLFFATTINYLDRQVLGILAKPLQKELDWSESQYGWIATAFTGAYAVGQLVVGGLMDRLGTRIGFSLAVICWSLAAMGHSLARLGVRLRHRPGRPGPERIGQLPRGHQDRGRMVPEDGARPRHRNLQLRLERRGDRRTARRALDRHPLRLAMGVLDHGRDGLRLARRLARNLPQARGASERHPRRAGLHPERPDRAARPRSPGPTCSATARPGPSRRASSSPTRSGGSSSSGCRSS